MNVWKHLSLLPNTAGYRCTVITHSGDTHPARVVLDIQRGTYRLALPDGVVYSDLRGWRE